MSTTEVKIEIDPRASRRIADLFYQVGDIARYAGNDSPVYTKTRDSLVNAIASVFGLLAAGGRLSTDGSHGLYVVTSYGMHVGMVFFRDRDFDIATIEPSEPDSLVNICVIHARPIPRDLGVCDKFDMEAHSFCMRRSCPVPGEWSLHS